MPTRRWTDRVERGASTCSHLRASAAVVRRFARRAPPADLGQRNEVRVQIEAQTLDVRGPNYLVQALKLLNPGHARRPCPIEVHLQSLPVDANPQRGKGIVIGENLGDAVAANVARGDDFQGRHRFWDERNGKLVHQFSPNQRLTSVVRSTSFPPKAGIEPV